MLRTRPASRSQKELRSGLYLELRSGLYLGPSGGAIGVLGWLEGPVPCTWAGCSAKWRARNHGQGVCEVVNHGGRRTGASGCGPSSALERAPRSSRGVQGKVPRRSAVGLFLKVPENFVHDLGLGENGDDFHFRAASRTNQRVYLKGDRFILHLLQWVRSGRGYLVVDAASYQRPMALVDRFGADQKATGLDRCPCERG